MTYPMKAICAELSILIGLQLVMPPVWAQSPGGQPNIVVIEGEAAINNIGSRVTRDPVIRVEDENHKAIAGAAVIFSLPTDGASGEFSNGSKTLIINTDEKGEAKSSGLRVNQVPGKLQIRVNASFRGRTAVTTITQFNMAVPGKSTGGSHGKIIAILAIAGAAAAGGVFATQKGKSNSTPSPAAPTVSAIGITAGTGSVGPPH